MKKARSTIVFLCAFTLCVHAQEGLMKVDVGTNEEFNRRATGTAAMNAMTPNIPDETNRETAKITAVLAKPAILKNATFEANEMPGNAKKPAGKFKKTAPTKISPPPLIPPVYPALSGWDPMIAAGDQYTIISMDHSLAFYDKNGNLLPDKPGGIKTSWSYTDFFQPVIDIANSNSFPELKNITAATQTACNTAGAAPGTCKELCEAYDSRVIYEPVNKRFIVLSAVRNTQWWYSSTYGPGSSPALCDPIAIRIFAFAISNTNDPRDGFKMWYWTKSNYRDWPRISADKDVLIVAHNGGGPAGVTSPSIYVISLADMMNGVTSPRYFTYFNGSGVTPASVIPVAKYPSTVSDFDNYEMFIQGNGSTANLYYFNKTATMWTNKPELKVASTNLGSNLDFSWYERPVYRNGNIYFTSRVMTAAPVVNLRPPIYGFTLYRLPLSSGNGSVGFNSSSSEKLIYNVFPPAATNSVYMSYDLPSISVDQRGTILAAYGRLAKTSTGYIFPETHYFLFFDNETGHRTSYILQPGSYMPMTTPPGWATPVMDGYNHDWKSDLNVDFTTVTPDPTKPYVFWIAHSFADKASGRYKMVVGEVEADQ